ncbi:hypothetical protein NTE_02191 [Candidatus Nitrososphaera evergladensis SR1]|uniref:C2H2-type domain-containing protein n=1 Tax=Candidatus Nitrososphaera evergladensis SR1 TaxID=1459636 RepID=A0A075MSV9_9ARCH|nr:hypothetical protein [Candidatus Nitrososphaera evergladensis]AIF84245.1 hypothetical protein NTE_02191 [Candidatus Nitrososphaera evergladensis SR1]
MELGNAKVYTSDKKSAGRVTRVDTEYFTTFKKGLTVDEEYRIPLDAILDVQTTEKSAVVKLALSREQLKHGYEILKGEPNSELVSGKAESELKIPFKKQVIHYEATKPLEENIAITPSKEGLPHDTQYSCDMCAEKFDDADSLQTHRADVHKGATGI